MKIISLEISNIGKIKSEIILFNKPLNLFFGQILQGKTTILNSIKLCFGGSFSKDLITHGEKEGYVKLKFDNGSIKRSFYIAKDDSLKDRAIEFIEDGEIVNKPTERIKNLLNPFLLDQNFLINKSYDNKLKYFIELLDIDTSEIDQELKDLKEKATTLRSDIKAAGSKELEVVEDPGSEEDLKTKVTDLENEKLNEFDYSKKLKVIEDLEKDLRIKKEELAKLETPRAKETIIEELDQANTDLSNLKADKIKYEVYTEEKKKMDQKALNEASLKKNEKKQKELAKKKVKLLETISEKSKIKDLSFTEDGEIIYQDTRIDMLSTSQLMNLSSECSSLYPEGLGIELIDHGESLGFASKESRKAIDLFIKRATKESKTILATIVGENPTEIPEDVGVFIVDDGKIKATNKKLIVAEDENGEKGVIEIDDDDTI